MVRSFRLHQPLRCLHLHEEEDNGGGVATHVKDSLKPKILTELQDSIKKKNIEATLTSIESSGMQTTLNNFLVEVTKLGLVILVGDINADLPKPDKYPAKALLQAMALN